MRPLAGPRRRLALAAACAVGIAVLVGVFAGRGAAAGSPVTFKMVQSTGAAAAGCLTGAHASVTVTPEGTVEQMAVHAVGLPANTDFDLFVIQVPNAPFGMAWYQGDLETNHNGVVDGTFIGRFSKETFIVAPGSAPAPVVHDADASTNPATAPVHTYHLGLWFNSPDDAAAAGCSNAQTPFNGEHNA